MITPNAFANIADQFGRLDHWEDRYRYIIELGQALPRLADGEKIDTNKVHGCVSRVWLVPRSSDAVGQINLTFTGESDAMIVQGLLAILLVIYSGRPAEQVAETDAVALFDGLGLRQHLTAQRSNGLVAIVKRIREEGRKYASR